MSKISRKEKIELSFVLGAVLIVAMVGLSLHFVQEGKLKAIAGAAVTLDPNIPTYPGTLVLLKDYCTPVSGTGTCDSICGKKICVPVENDCTESMSKNNCLCCDYPKWWKWMR